MIDVFSARWSAYWLIFLLVTFYVATPMCAHLFVLRHPHFPQLALLTTVGCACIALGFWMPFLDRRFEPEATRIPIDARVFHTFLWGLFGVLLLVTYLTAPSVPLFSALRGASGPELDVERAAFLKGRVGWQTILPYAHTVLTGALLPYSLAWLFIKRSRNRFVAFSVFLFYTQSFLVKALFVKVVAPLFYVLARQRRFSAAAGLFLFSGGLLYVNASLARIVAEPPVDVLAVSPVPPEPPVGPVVEVKPTEAVESESPSMPAEKPSRPPWTRVDPLHGSVEPSFFGARYRASSRVGFLVWRVFAVPTFTAADALRVFHEREEKGFLMGATSTTFSKVFGLERVPFESDVFAFQWGRSPYGRSNSLYVAEAYVNFGWTGVVAFSLLIGQALRWFYLSKDEAFKSLWPLFAFFVAQGGLLGTLLSNGFLFFFLLGLFVLLNGATAEDGEGRPFRVVSD